MSIKKYAYPQKRNNLALDRICQSAYIKAMDIPTIPDLEDRAHAAGLSIDEVCVKAGINRSTWTRWKADTMSPTIRKLQRVVKVIESRERRA